jgi:phage-related protein/predicted XRE-type DNA-binding protein
VAETKLKALVWVGSSRRDMRAMPKEVRRSFGVALYAVQTGETPPSAKVLKGFGGGGVLKLIEDDAVGTYRAVYTVRYVAAISVCCMCSRRNRSAAGRFRNGTGFGQRTAEARGRTARNEGEGESAMKRRRDYEESSGNVFADLGFRNSKQELLKAKLTIEIYKLLKRRGVTQTEAAKLLGTTQAQVSALMRCKPVSVSVGRLMEFLNVLGQDVEVTVKPAARRRKTGEMSVVVQTA